MTASHSTAISVISATYNVADYLPQYLESLDAQCAPRDRFEVIFVIDGSPDSSEAIIREWASTTDVVHRVLTQENGGVARARNAGLAAATGDWVTFADPDDVLDKNYLSAVLSYIESGEAEGAAMLAARNVRFGNDDEDAAGGHPLAKKFRFKTNLIDLRSYPSGIHFSVAVGFFRRADVERFRLSFRPAVQPHGSDGVFTVEFLLESAAPTIGLVHGAKYRYRIRPGSIVRSAWDSFDRLTVLPRESYLYLLDRAEALHGHVPEWVQTAIIYKTAVTFIKSKTAHGYSGALPQDVRDTWIDLLRQIFSRIDPPTVAGYSLSSTSPEVRFAMGAFGGHDLSRPAVHIHSFDYARQLVGVRYLSDHKPSEEYRVGHERVVPRMAKWRPIEFFGVRVGWERNVWLPTTGVLSVLLDGERLPVFIGDDRAPRLSAKMSEVKGRWPRTEAPQLYSRATWWAESLKGALRNPSEGISADYWRGREAAWVAAGGWAAEPYRSRFSGAWLLIDRGTEANDNAEHLCRYLMNHQPQVNAHYVLSRASADWARLTQEGFPLVELGSTEHLALAMNARHLISSHSSDHTVNPFPQVGTPSYQVTYLQHGVTKDDTSRGLNRKAVDLMVATAPAEYGAFVADESPYRVGMREVRHTGFPRYDALLHKADRTNLQSRRVVFIAPTWRGDLLGKRGESNLRDAATDVRQSSYFRNWLALVGHPALRAAAQDSGLRIVFIPHPNMARFIEPSDLPAYVEMHTYATSDVQQLLAESVLTVTDYSSIIFDGAYLERPCVAFQFDRDAMRSGVNSMGLQPGYFDWERDGFGPVETDVDRAVDAIITVAAQGPSAEYLGRMRAFFTLRDGRCCERTYHAITEMEQPMPFDEVAERYRPSAADTAATQPGASDE